jgi:hypothetical protein
MDQGAIKPESLQELFHKKKVAKKKATGLLPLVQKNNSTIGEGTTADFKTQVPIEKKAIEQTDNSQITPKRATKSIIYNAEVDEYLEQLLISGLVSEQYWSWAAKCVHTLGIQKTNRLVLQARKGRQPQRLLASKLKGAMELHFKRKFYLEDNYNVSTELKDQLK